MDSSVVFSNTIYISRSIKSVNICSESWWEDQMDMGFLTKCYYNSIKKNPSQSFNSCSSQSVVNKLHQSFYRLPAVWFLLQTTSLWSSV